MFRYFIVLLFDFFVNVNIMLLFYSLFFLSSTIFIILLKNGLLADNVSFEHEWKDSFRGKTENVSYQLQ